MYIIHSSSVPFFVLQLLPLGKLIVIRYVAELMTTDCRTLQHCRPLSTAYKTVLYAVDKGLWCRSVLQPFVINSATYLFTISSTDIDKVAMSLYDFYCCLAILWWVLCVFMCMHCWCSRTGTNMLHYAGTKDKRAVTSQFVTAYRSVMQPVNAHVNIHCMLLVCSGQWASNTWSDAVSAVEHSLGNLNILLNYAWFCLFQCAGLRLRGWQLLINAWRTYSWETSPTYHIHSSWGTSEGTGSPLPWGKVDQSCLDLTVEIQVKITCKSEYLDTARGRWHCTLHCLPWWMMVAETFHLVSSVLASVTADCFRCIFLATQAFTIELFMCNSRFEWATLPPYAIWLHPQLPPCAAEVFQQTLPLSTLLWTPWGTMASSTTLGCNDLARQPFPHTRLEGEATATPHTHQAKVQPRLYAFCSWGSRGKRQSHNIMFSVQSACIRVYTYYIVCTYVCARTVLGVHTYICVHVEVQNQTFQPQSRVLTSDPPTDDDPGPLYIVPN